MGYKILILYRYRLTIDIISIYLHRIIDIIRINSCFIYFSSVYSFQEGGVIGLFYTSLRKSRKSKNIQQNNNYDRNNVIYIQRPLLWFFEFRFMQSPPLSYSILLYPQCYIKWYSLVVHSTTFSVNFKDASSDFINFLELKIFPNNTFILKKSLQAT